MRESEERERLLRELSRSRDAMNRGLSGVSHAVNVRERIGRSMRKHSAWWIGGAAASGFLLATLASRPPAKDGKRSERRGGLEGAGTLLGLAGSLARSVLPFLAPILKAVVLRYIDQRSADE